MYSLESQTVGVKEIFCGDGFNLANPVSSQGYFLGRWFRKIFTSNVGIPQFESMSTFNHGSEIIAEITNTTSLKIKLFQWGGFVSYSLNDGNVVRLPHVTVDNTTTPVDVDVVSGLDKTKKYKIRIIHASMGTGADKWTFAANTFNFCGFVGDDNSFEVKPLYPTNRRILFLGDSITDGLSAYAPGGFANNVSCGDIVFGKIASKMLNSLGIISGFGSTGIVRKGISGVPRAYEHIKYLYNTKETTLEEPDVIVLAYGANDGKADPDLHNTTKAEFMDAYREVIDFLIAKWGKKPLVFLEVHNINDTRYWIQELADSYDHAYFVGTYQEGITVSATLDGLHPDPVGHQTIGEHLATRLKGIFGDEFFGL
ncbi:GDSL-like Lipase/Acylhydrolase [compost metagenome]